MRQRNVHYERGLPGCALEGLPEHRRRVDHRRGFVGQDHPRGPSPPGPLTPSGGQIGRLYPSSPKF
jgi:hypothetical protein